MSVFHFILLLESNLQQIAGEYPANTPRVFHVETSVICTVVQTYLAPCQNIFGV